MKVNFWNIKFWIKKKNQEIRAILKGLEDHSTADKSKSDRDKKDDNDDHWTCCLSMSLEKERGKTEE